MKRFFLPLGLFLILSVFLAVGLKLDPREVPSPLIDKDGVIRFKQIGPVTPKVLERTILPLVRKLQG